MNATTANSILRTVVEHLVDHEQMPLHWVIEHGMLSRGPRFETAWRTASESELLLGVAAFVFPRKTLVIAMAAVVRSMLPPIDRGPDADPEAGRPLRVIEMLDEWARSDASAITYDLIGYAARSSTLDYYDPAIAEAAYAANIVTFVAYAPRPDDLFYSSGSIDRLAISARRDVYTKRGLTDFVRSHLPAITLEMLLEATARG